MAVVVDLFATFHFELGKDSYYPSGAEQTSDTRLFGMYHSNTPQYNKGVIFKNISRPDRIIRIVFATVALGMGEPKRSELLHTLWCPQRPSSVLLAPSWKSYAPSHLQPTHLHIGLLPCIHQLWLLKLPLDVGQTQTIAWLI